MISSIEPRRAQRLWHTFSSHQGRLVFQWLFANTKVPSTQWFLAPNVALLRQVAFYNFPPCIHLSVYDIFGALVAGGTLVMLPLERMAPDSPLGYSA